MQTHTEQRQERSKGGMRVGVQKVSLDIKLKKRSFSPAVGMKPEGTKHLGYFFVNLRVGKASYRFFSTGTDQKKRWLQVS
jgi:hypothetical protein